MAAIALWETFSKFSPWIPSAVGVLRLVWENLNSESFLFAVVGSLRRMVIGYCIVCTLGIGTGLALGRFRFLDDLLGTVAVAIHSMPGAAWVPLSILLFGFTESAVIFSIVLGATGIVMVHTSAGIKDVPPLILQAARTMGAKGAAMFWYVVVPAAIPRIVDGLRLAWAFGWRALMAGELLVASVYGMGKLLSEVAKKQQMHQLLAFMLIIAVIGMLVDGLIFRRMEKSVRTRWGTA
ncbi:MAG: ABC transporter permease subunit [Candidatus Omnitrophica bacterium]|nr:ABC transporter permease subunit [Candidatus Omnitrophota bacterium]